MAVQDPGLDVGYVQAGADLSAKQFLAVKVSGDLAVNLASTGGEAILGILQNKPTSGAAADVRFTGISKAVAGVGGWTAGQELATEASTGKLVAAAGADVIVAVALQAVSADEIGAVLVLGGSAYPHA